MSVILMKIFGTVVWIIPWVLLAVYAKKRAKQGLLDLAWVMSGVSALMLVWMFIALVIRWSSLVLSA